MSLEEARDIIIIIYGVMGILVFLVALALAVIAFLLIRSLKRKVEELVDDPIRPVLEEVRGTAQNVRGTTEFVTDKAVSPIIRIVSVVRGVRRGASVVAGRRPGRR